MGGLGGGGWVGCQSVGRSVGQLVGMVWYGVFVFI